MKLWAGHLYLREGFTFDDAEFLKVPIWLKLPSLPMDCWDEEVINMIASRVGVPIFTDGIANEKSRLNFTRMLVEVDVAMPPPLFVDIKLPLGGLEDNLCYMRRSLTTLFIANVMDTILLHARSYISRKGRGRSVRTMWFLASKLCIP
ncbi:unnamed protein product [Cuscuta epithymum]|uniref:DUF4283 domain-containing protein n=1 Tax=Cuscuta epithymum TaxID=186058 RepID=A0AAV0F2K2_9ASTE|nr:unnamed protein product [Cuscuta epithymum]